MRALPTAIAALALAGCTLPPITTATPRPTATPTVLRTPIITPPPSIAPSVEPTPDLAAVPDFSASEIVTSTIQGLRVRVRPGLDQGMVPGLLPFSAELQVVMGPMVVDEIGWYLVRDADPDEPTFEEGWVAAGYEPEPLLRTAGRRAENSPFIASFAQTGNAEYGPIGIGDERHAIRWLAMDPEGVRCQFNVLLASGAADPIPAIRATIGDGLVPGLITSTFFIAQPEIRGQVFLTVETDCAWTLVVMREVDPGSSPSP